MQQSPSSSSYSKRASQKNTKRILLALTISRIVIGYLVWTLFFKASDLPVDPVGLDQEQEADSLTYFIGESVVLTGMLTPKDGFNAYTHTFRSAQ